MKTALFVSLILFSAWLPASGPADRTVTDPKSVSSPQNLKAVPVIIEDLFYTHRTRGSSWSPSGSDIAYSSSASGRFNIWKMKADGSAPQQLTKSEEIQSDPIWSPDGKYLVFQQDKGGDEMYDLYAVRSDGGTPQNLTNTPENRESNAHFSHDGQWISFDSKQKTSPVTNIGMMDWKTRKSSLLTHESSQDHSWSVAFWSPDDRFLYATRTYRGDEDGDIYRIDVKSGNAENLTQHSGKVLNQRGAISPDGDHLLFTSNEKGGFNNVVLLNLANKQKKWITDTKWEAEAGDWSPLGDHFLYSENADGRTSLFSATSDGGKTTKIALPEGINELGGNPHAFSPDGSLLLVMHQDSTRPGDMWVLSATGGPPKQVTYSARQSLSNVPLPGSRVITYKSFDGKLISAFLWMPFNLKRDGTNAAIVLPHGGPTGQTRDAFNSTALALASRGYIVIAPNVRGSTGYGMDFQHANHQDLGGGDLQDEVYAVNWLKKTGYVDPKKIGITGGSYGGFMTLMAIGKTPDLWAAAVQLFGIIDWKTMLQHSDPSLQEYIKSLLGDPVTDVAAYEAASPIKYIRNEKAPLLVLQGERDIRVPAEEARQVVEILQKENRTVDAHYYPDEGHGFAKREDQIDSLTRLVAWFDKYLRGSGSRLPH